MKHISIAIDGYSACGKSTLAKDLAEKLSYVYIDSGAMYRAATLYFISHSISPKDNETILNHLDDIHISFQRIENDNIIFLNGSDISKEIRKMDVTNQVSDYATISALRSKLVFNQRELSKKTNVVMDGRDIGTVVLPDAALKLFVICDIDVRTQRRLDELRSKGIDEAFDTIKENLLKRDYIDSHREDSPLTQAEDAVIIDTTNLTRSSQLDMALDLLHKTL